MMILDTFYSVTILNHYLTSSVWYADAVVHVICLNSDFKSRESQTVYMLLYFPWDGNVGERSLSKKIKRH